MDSHLYRFISKKGKEITLRYPLSTDVGILLDFAHHLIDEDAYIKISGVTSRNDLTHENEEKYVLDLLKEISEKQGIHALAFHEDRLIGNAGITKGSVRKEHVGLLGISIHRDFRGEGIGREMMTYLLGEAKKIGLTIIELKVYGPNSQAIHLYKKLGFEEVGRLPDSIRYRDTFLDEVWMAKKL